MVGVYILDGVQQINWAFHILANCKFNWTLVTFYVSIFAFLHLGVVDLDVFHFQSKHQGDHTKDKEKETQNSQHYYEMLRVLYSLVLPLEQDCEPRVFLHLGLSHLFSPRLLLLVLLDRKHEINWLMFKFSLLYNFYFVTTPTPKKPVSSNRHQYFFRQLKINNYIYNDWVALFP